MEIIQVVGVALLASLLILVLKQIRPELALFVTLVVAAGLFGLVLTKVGAIFDILQQLASKANVNQAYLGTVLKIIGIAYIAEFGAQVCRDAGEGAIAGKVELVAKILILILAVPVILAIIQSVLGLMP
ncbi:MAG: stage III sporulation protein AD [Bacillota bacterium]|uniref:Stage III sporulation protein AD n=2 Tax=Carboxydocella TaxID=178898 RepID=A0A1T4S956_9FIRM|nr:MULTISPECIES: stage III sporulation protein AD [Carboxydocella]AVX20135.1 stage III sporulation protein AD [Carboxydocella thermautotrophica]GAW28449.1 stage III sporulation protein AD [Carboxydocella sp. ULO1]GAW31774.1 stage III sporulation protein AD [Carboxydocella sp. JDF658]SKA24820.1 stage III sporulation protein AD [Carboxydocella sporoproducens DSM 16521]